MICNRYCCLLKMTRSSYTRTSIWHAKNTNEDEDTVSCFGPVVIVVFSFRGETNGNWSASHIVHTWDGLGPFAHLFAPASSLWSWLNSHQTTEWDQMILTTGKYLWAEKSNSGSAWRCTGLSHQSIHHSKSRDSQIVRGIYVVCHLGLLFMSTSQELHDHNVGFGHLQYAIHLLTTKNINKWLPIIPVAVNIFTQRERTFEVKDIL